MKKIKYLLLFFSVFLLLGCTDEKKEEPVTGNNEEIQSDFEIGESFEFMDFEVTINKIKGFTKIDKEYSADDGLEIIKLPITIKNNGSSKDHLSMFYYKMYSPDNKEILSKGQYFDESLDYAADLNPGESYTKYIYIPYSGNGNYILEFNNFSNKIKIVLNVKK